MNIKDFININILIIIMYIFLLNFLKINFSMVLLMNYEILFNIYQIFY